MGRANVFLLLAALAACGGREEPVRVPQRVIPTPRYSPPASRPKPEAELGPLRSLRRTERFEVHVHQDGLRTYALDEQGRPRGPALSVSPAKGVGGGSAGRAGHVVLRATMDDLYPPEP